MDNFSLNKKNIIQYLESGCKNKEVALHFGVELEHFMVKASTKEAVPYFGDGGVEAVLTELVPFYKECAYSEGHLIALGREGIALSLEPAAQLEVSISPQREISDIKSIYERFLSEITPVLQKYSYELVTEGYQPVSRAEELELIPKARYRFMDRYFAKIGPFGRQMMRGTAATQVSIDYYSEEDFQKKYKAAYRLKEVLSYFCNNASSYEGGAYNGYYLRDKIWSKTDKRRVDVSPFLKEGTLSFADYADFVLQAPVIVNKEGDMEQYDERTVGEIAKEHLFTKDEIEHVLSMVFPMIRAKHFLELRFADSMQIQRVSAYVLVLKGLFEDIGYTESWLYTNEFGNRNLSGQMEYMLKQIMGRLSSEEMDYIKGNRSL